MPTVHRTAGAERDLEAILLHIAQDNPLAALRWIDKIAELFELLATQPSMGEEFQSRQLQSLRLYPFGNYVIYYLPFDGGIEVIRVMHGARDQSSWLRT